LTTLRRISAATLLSLTLSICVLAGQTDTPGTPAPAPPPAGTASQITGTTTDILLAVLDLIYR